MKRKMKTTTTTTTKENHLKLIPQKNGMYYNANHNYLITRTNKSCSGNIYHTCLRISEKLSIVFKLGIGNSIVFLNEITIYSYPNGKRRIIGTQLYNRFEYNEAEIISCAKQIIYKDIVRTFNEKRTYFDTTRMKEHIEILVDDTMRDYSILF